MLCALHHGPTGARGRRNSEGGVGNFPRRGGRSHLVTTPSTVFEGRISLDVSQGEGGKAKILSALGKIDRGVAV